MIDSVQILARNTDSMQFIGKSLVSSLYATPQCLITLSGPLGAGKTTLTQGIAQGLGVQESLTSPTYALEQRYPLKHPLYAQLLHLDLYRLDGPQIREATTHLQEEHGLIVIEWADKLDNPLDLPSIHIACEEHDEGRLVTIRFEDIALPTTETVHKWRSEVQLPKNVADHCDAVGKRAKELAEEYAARGHAVRPLALQRAGEVHDLLRFLDFTEKSAPAGTVHDIRLVAEWRRIQEEYPHQTHEHAIGVFLEQQGYPELGAIVPTHGNGEPYPVSNEQKLLRYADKRVTGTTPVSVRGRFAEAAERYEGGTMSAIQKEWMEETLELEKELFGSKVP